MKNSISKKKLMVVIVTILIIITITFAFFIKLDKHKTNSDNPSREYQKIDGTKDLYYIQKGNTYGVYESIAIGEEGIWSAKDKELIHNVSFDYPVININTDSVIKLNNSIKEYYNKLEKSYKDLVINDACTCIKIDDTFYCEDHIETLNYYIDNADNYITILIRGTIDSVCASGYGYLKGYVVSKKTGEVLNNKDILNYYKYDDSKLLKEYNRYMKNEYSLNNMGDEFTNEEKIDDLSLLIYNNKLIIIAMSPSGDDMTLSYDGKVIKEYDLKPSN